MWSRISARLEALGALGGQREIMVKSWGKGVEMGRTCDLGYAGKKMKPQGKII